MGLAKVSHQRESREGPGQGPLPCSFPVLPWQDASPTMPLYQHCLRELVQCQAGPASSRVFGVTQSLPLIHLDIAPPRMQSRSSSSPLDVQLILQMRKHAYFQGHVCKCNPG